MKVGDLVRTKQQPWMGDGYDDNDFGFIQKEKGMFSFLGVTQNQIQELINKYAIYLVDSSRINVASINKGNIDYVTESIVNVIKIT